MKLLIPYIFILFPLLVSSQVRIAGTCDRYKETPISLMYKDDCVSNTMIDIQEQEVDQFGFFVLAPDIKKTGKYFIKIENRLVPIYLEPDSEYEIKLTPPDNLNNRVSRIVLEYQGTSTKQQKGIAQEIESFDEDINNFLYDNDALIHREAFLPKVDSAKIALEKKYQGAIKNWSFFKTSFNYQFASLFLLSKKSKKKTHQEFINNHPIDYKNETQLFFLKQFYNSNFSKARLKLHHQFDSISSSPNAREDLIEQLKKDSLVKTNQLAELILLFELKKSIRSKTIKKEYNTQILNQIAERSSNKEHIRIAANLLTKRNRLKVGSIAPNIEAVTVRGKTFELEKHLGKRYIYLGFFASWNKASVLDLKIIQRIKKKYGKQIEFINISVDRNPEDFKQLIARYKFNWSVVHFDNNYKMLEDFNIKSFPVYFLISPEGKLVMSPAEKPAMMFDKFERINQKLPLGVKSYELIEDYQDD